MTLLDAESQRMQLVLPARALSLADWCDLQVDDELAKRIELVAGGLVVMAPPATGHAVVISRLSTWLIDAGFLPDQVLAGIGLVTGQSSARIPDLVLLRSAPQAGERIIDDAGRVRLAIEVVSPSTAAQDRFVKPGEYAAAGVEWFWRVEGAADPDTALVHRRHRMLGDLPPLALADVRGCDPEDLLKA